MPGWIMAETYKIELRNVHKWFGAKNVLNGVSLAVPTGTSLVIIGGSGTGKSVTIKCILGLLKPDKGQILIDGKDVTRGSLRTRQAINDCAGTLFQGAALFDSLRVWENVAFKPMRTQHINRRNAKDLAIAKLAKVGLGPEVGELYPAELSGGMQKRVGLARAIATDPEIIFFDEPTTGLDPIMADVINDLIINAVTDLGATTLSITHDMASARKIADSIAMIHMGQIIWHGPVSEIDNSGNPFVEQFINGRAEGPIHMEVLKR
jgi:phospholipid/cholesterol/gamma-HCH transport system ATP-binding protein